MSSTPPPPPPPGGASPQPAGGPPGVPGPLASWGERAIASLITGGITLALFVVAFILVAIFGAIADVLGLLVGLVLYLAAIGVGLYFYYLDGEVGGHPGKRLTGLKTVNADTGETIGGGMGIARGVAHFVDQIVCYLGYLLPLFDDKRQTIADKIVSTVVISGQPKMDFGPDIFKP